MLPEVGQFALALALCMAIVQTVAPLAAPRDVRGLRWRHLGLGAARAQILLVILAYACLTYAFWVSDFSVAYVVANSNRELPLFYRLAAVWGGHEGSILLWAMVLSGWTLAVLGASSGLNEAFRARVIAVMGSISAGLLLFILITSNPFERLLPAAAAGRDLNPLLQDPGMIIHPPLLYMGYVGLCVPFAFAISALLEGRIDAAWTRWTRPWVVTAWVFLTLGITIGSWWAYSELGWGGWWFWDPVENASLMPWLVATALIHSLAVTERRGGFRAWTLLLAICAFSLSLLGTFLVRSGVLVSVHAFATDPARGVFILVFLTLVIGSALILFAWRAPALSGGNAGEAFSRETLMLINNVLLVAVAGSTLLGTLYPLIMDALGLGKISVGPPYFDRIAVPLLIPLALIAGAGPQVRWMRDDWRRHRQRWLWVGVSVSAIATVTLWQIPAPRPALVMVGLATGLWVLVQTALGVSDRIRGGGVGAWRQMLRAGFMGMSLAHLGFGIAIIGITAVSTWTIEDDVRLSAGQTHTLRGYQLRFQGVQDVAGPNYRAVRATVEVTRDGNPVAILYPEKRSYRVQSQPMTEAAVDASLLRDIYVALGDPFPGGEWALRMQYKPLVRLIWLGPIIMAIGGLISLGDRRYRRHAAPVAARSEWTRTQASAS